MSCTPASANKRLAHDPHPQEISESLSHESDRLPRRSAKQTRRYGVASRMAKHSGSVPLLAASPELPRPSTRVARGDVPNKLLASNVFDKRVDQTGESTTLTKFSRVVTKNMIRN